MIILAIETSCDETSAAVVDGDRVLSSVVWSQIKDHRRWGGVVPSVARRAHKERLPIVVAAALRRANLANKPNSTNLSAVAVTIGPGLAPALAAGGGFSKNLALEKKLPLIPVNHLEGHIASLFLRKKTGTPFISHFNHSSHSNRFLSLIVSGGHTELVLSESSPPSHHILGATLDDAAGECLDKVGRELGLGYPAGPVLERFAKDGDSGKFKFPIPLERSPRTDLNFSFSGLKTAAIQTLYQSHNIKKVSLRKQKQLSRQEICDFCASFQKTSIDALLFKLKRAIEKTGVKTVFLSGGVAANNQLRRRAGILVRSLGGSFYPAPKKFTGDNAAMIGLAAQWAFARGEAAKTEVEINLIDRQPNLNFD